MTSARRQRASETEHTVAGWFKVNGWPYAEPVGAGRSGTDVTGIPGLLVEVKARRDFRPVEWLRQHRDVSADRVRLPLTASPAPVFVVWRPDGMGPLSVASWGVMMRLDDFTALLHEAGYGTRED